ncbi:hypothetical protein [Caenimonas koreensis]|uniref:hypothetical protein n=1 Tax=Caenimonas koreensis TaxID=367474 RepID=UPI003782E5A1
MADDDIDRTASLMTPAKLAQVKPRAAASPAAWLDQMAADAAHQNVRRIAELRRQFKEQAKARDDSAIAAGIARLAKALPHLDFGLLQGHGIWSRMTGKSRAAATEFAGRFDKLKAAADEVTALIKGFDKQVRDQAPAGDLSLLDLEVEYKAIEKVQDQGARWLQDMRSQLKTRHAQDNDAAAAKQIGDDEARCEILVARLKVLREVSAAAQGAHQAARAAVARRLSLAQAPQQLGARLADWRSKMQALVDATTGEGESASVDAAMECHRDLQLALRDAGADCAQMRAQDNALAESLHALKQQLEAAQARSPA